MGTTKALCARAGLGALTGLLVIASSACKKDGTPATDTAEGPQALAEDGTDSAAAEIDAEIVTSSLVSPTPSSGSLTLASTSELAGGGLATAGVGDGAKALYFPKGCLTVASDDAAKTVTYDFADCAGPNGIFRIRGRVVATYAAAPGMLTLDLVGNDLQVNRSTIDWTAHAAISAAGLARSMHWQGTLSGTTARGKTFSRTNTKDVAWRFGERCYAVSGISEGKVRERFLRTEITDFRRCQGACPEAGGKITISNAAKLKVEITFDGTPQATFMTPKGTSVVDLACTG
jgi:hypothetical protein